MKRRRDRVAFIGMMVARLGGTLAVLIGIALYLDYKAVMEHMGAGLLVLVGVVIVATRFTMIGRPVMPLWASVLVLVSGMTVALGYWGDGLGLVHATIMLLGFGLAEMGAARAGRA